MVGEVAFADGIQSRDSGHQVVIHPQTSHGVVDCRINHHRVVVRIYGSNLLVHLEQVTIAFLNGVASQLLDCIFEIEEYRFAGVVHAEAGVASLFGGTGSYVTGH